MRYFKDTKGNSLLSVEADKFNTPDAYIEISEDEYNSEASSLKELTEKLLQENTNRMQSEKEKQKLGKQKAIKELAEKLGVSADLIESALK